MTERTGRCLCGAVTFTVTGEPLTTRVCWCRDCQHIGANGTVNMVVPAEALQVHGTLTEYTLTADSGNRLTRHFCPGCGAHIHSVSSARPHLRVVRVGNLDDPSSVRPTMNVWTRSAPAWACLDPALEQIAQQPG